MRAFLAMVKANLKMTFRNRTALFWNLVFPVLFIVLFGAVLGNDPSLDITVGVTGEQSTFQQEVIAALEADDIYHVHTGGALDNELQQLKDGDRDIVLDFAATSNGSLPAVTQYYDDTRGPNARIATSVVSQLLLRVGQGENPVPLDTVGVSGANIDFIDFFVPGVLAMAIMNAGVIGLSTSFVTYRERGILRRIKVTPFPLSSFVLARVVSQLVIAVVQALVLIGVAKLLFGLDVRGNPLLILLMIIVGALAFLAIGFAVSSIAPNAETAASYANLITFPMLFLSGVFFEIDSAPQWLQSVTRVMPLRYLVDGLREPMTRGKGLEAVWVDLVALGITFVIGMLVAVRFFRWEARGS